MRLNPGEEVRFRCRLEDEQGNTIGVVDLGTADGLQYVRAMIEKFTREGDLARAEQTRAFLARFLDFAGVDRP